MEDKERLLRLEAALKEADQRVARIERAMKFLAAETGHGERIESILNATVARKR